MIAKLLKHTSLYAVGPQIPKIASIFVLPILIKDLSPFDYAISGLVSAYIGAFAALKVLGLEEIIINYYYKKPKSFVLIWSHLYSFLSRYIFLFGLGVAVLLYFTLPDEIGNNIFLLITLIIIPIVIFDITVMFGSRYLQLLQKPKPIMIITAISGLMVVFLNLFTISYLKLGYLGWYISTLIASLFGFIAYGFILFKRVKLTPFIRPRLKFLKKYLKISLPLVPNRYGQYFLNTSDRVVMDIVKVPTNQLGIYTLGYNLGAYSQVFTDAVGIAVGPLLLEKLAEKGKENLKYLRDFIFKLQVLFILVTVSASIWAKEIFSVLVPNESLSSSYDIAIFIFMSQNYGPLWFFYTSVIVFHEKTKVLWRVTFTAGVVNILLNFLLIPIWGFKVAAATTLLSMTILSVFGYYFSSYKNFGYEKLYPQFWMTIVIILTFAVYSVRDINWFQKLGIHLAILTIGLISFYWISRSMKFNKVILNNEEKLNNN